MAQHNKTTMCITRKDRHVTDLSLKGCVLLAKAELNYLNT